MIRRDPVGFAIVVFGLAIGLAGHLQGRHLWAQECRLALNHSGVQECHLDGLPPAPPVTFMAVDTTAHLVIR